MSNRTQYHGWIVVAEPEPGYRPSVTVEWNEDGERKREVMGLKGNSGCAQAIEWWYRKMGKPIKLEKLPIGYRVFTDENA